MARARQVVVAALNIVTHPHSEKRYIDLIKDLFALKRPVAVYGEQRMLISSIDTSDEENGIVTGSIARFTEIASDLPWFNQNTLSVAEDNDVQSISIPEGLKPNYVSFLFYFDAKTHTFVFEQHLSSFNVSVNSVFKLISNLAYDDVIELLYGPVKVTQIQDKEAINEVFKIFKLREIRILVNRPNPDDLSSFDEDVQRRLGNMHATSLEVNLKSDRSLSIQPDAGTKALAEVATRNGVVEAHGLDANGAAQTNSTRSHPMLVPYTFTNTHPSLGKADMAGAAQKLLDMLTRKST